MSKIINQLKPLYTLDSRHNNPRVSFLPFDFRPAYTLRVMSGMLSTFGLLLSFSLLTIQSCGFDIEDPTPPSPPVWVQKSLPEEWPERGIDAHESGGIYLEWETNAEENIVAYLIYRSEYFDEKDSLGEYALLARIENSSLDALGYLDSHVSIISVYNYKLKAENTSENLSIFSDSLSYSLLLAISANRMFPNGLTDTLVDGNVLTWFYSSSIEMEDYCLTIIDQDEELVYRQVLSPISYIDRTESWQIPSFILLESNQIYKWRVDTNAKYIFGIETTGSESPWAPFIYLGP
jgi:hypothetical protein